MVANGGRKEQKGVAMGMPRIQRHFTVTFYSDILSEICYLVRGGIAYYEFGKGNGNFRISTAAGHCILGLNQTAI